MNNAGSQKKIVVVGGGAGGLELVTKLGNKLGKKKKAEIYLVDTNLTHLWKPLWHEAAAGRLDVGNNEISYLHHAVRNNYTFILGQLIGLDRNRKVIFLAPIFDNDQNETIKAREIPYDLLVIAIGSVSNDFSVPGAKENCFYLDSHQQVHNFQQRFSQLLIQFITPGENQNQSLEIAIVGGGATGIELAVELLMGTRYAIRYGIKDKVSPPIKISIIEAADRLAPQLAPEASNSIKQYLISQGIQVFTSTKVSEVTSTGFITTEGKIIPAALRVWAAGVKAPEFLRDLDKLETAPSNQLIVNATLQTTYDPNVFAFGDCAYCPQNNARIKVVPPRAQAAHQQANLLAKSLIGYLFDKPLLPFVYRDRGSLISLSESKAIGQIMGLSSKSSAKGWLIYGKLAHLMYTSLYKLHQTAVYGLWRTIMLSMAGWLTGRVKPPLKLH